METDEIILGRINLNAFKSEDKKRIQPVIELLDYSGAFHG